MKTISTILTIGLSVAIFSGCSSKQTTLKDKTFESKVIKDFVNNNNISNISIQKEAISIATKNDLDNPLLSKPKIATIKIFSYVDKDGNYHEDSVIHTKIESSNFIENKKYFTINNEE